MSNYYDLQLELRSSEKSVKSIGSQPSTFDSEDYEKLSARLDTAKYVFTGGGIALPGILGKTSAGLAVISEILAKMAEQKAKEEKAKEEAAKKEQARKESERKEREKFQKDLRDYAGEKGRKDVRDHDLRGYRDSPREISDRARSIA